MLQYAHTTEITSHSECFLSQTKLQRSKLFAHRHCSSHRDPEEETKWATGWWRSVTGPQIASDTSAVSTQSSNRKRKARLPPHVIIVLTASLIGSIWRHAS